MKKKIFVTEEFEISGAWTCQGSRHIFEGKVTKPKDSRFSFPLQFEIPASAMKRFGQALMEEDIKISVINEIKNNGSGYVQNEGMDRKHCRSFRTRAPNMLSRFSAIFRRSSIDTHETETG